MKYTCDDFIEYKLERGRMCTVGKFGDNIYAVKYAVADGHNSYHNEYFEITAAEFNAYPENTEKLAEKYYRGHSSFLCSDYMGKGHKTYGFEEMRN